MQNWQTMLFSAEGRIRRLHYWLWSLGLSVVFGVGVGVFGAMTGAFDGRNGDGGSAIFGLFSLACAIILTWIHFCLIVKRWHDRDKSGWWILIGLIPVIGGIWALIECGFLDGTQGPNKYGPSPKGIGSAEKVF